jgi:hypothetical protein
MPRRPAKPLDISQRLRRHVEVTDTMRDLIGQPEALRDAGNVAGARRLLKMIDALHRELVKLEG